MFLFVFLCSCQEGIIYSSAVCLEALHLIGHVPSDGYVHSVACSGQCLRQVNTTFRWTNDSILVIVFGTCVNGNKRVSFASIMYEGWFRACMKTVYCC